MMHKCFIITTNEVSTTHDLWNKGEFDTEIIQLRKRSTQFDIWISIRDVIKLSNMADYENIIIAQDCHQFTSDYNAEYLMASIAQVKKIGGDILLGGGETEGIAVPISKNIFWIDHILQSAFIVIFRPLFQNIIETQFENVGEPSLTNNISYLSRMKFIMCPMISTTQTSGRESIHNLRKHNDTNERLRITNEMYCKFYS